VPLCGLIAVNERLSLVNVTTTKTHDLIYSSNEGKQMIRTYLGVFIFKNPLPFNRLKYTARLNSGEPLAADTLAGIKQLIREKTPPRLTRKDKDEAMAGLGLTKVTVNGKVFYE